MSRAKLPNFRLRGGMTGEEPELGGGGEPDPNILGITGLPVTASRGELEALIEPNPSLGIAGGFVGVDSVGAARGELFVFKEPSPSFGTAGLVASEGVEHGEPLSEPRPSFGMTGGLVGVISD